jgi:hypothetical protein
MLPNPQPQTKSRRVGLVLAGLIGFVTITILFSLLLPLINKIIPRTKTKNTNLAKIDLSQKLGDEENQKFFNQQKQAQELVQKIVQKYSLPPFPYTLLNPKKIHQNSNQTYWKISIPNFSLAPIIQKIQKALVKNPDLIDVNQLTIDFLVKIDNQNSENSQSLANLELSQLNQNSFYPVGDNGSNLFFNPKKNTSYNNFNNPEPVATSFNIFQFDYENPNFESTLNSFFSPRTAHDIYNLPTINKTINFPFSISNSENFFSSLQTTQNILALDYYSPKIGQSVKNQNTIYGYRISDLSQTQPQPIFVLDLAQTAQEIEKIDKPLFDQSLQNSSNISFFYKNLDKIAQTDKIEELISTLTEIEESVSTLADEETIRSQPSSQNISDTTQINQTDQDIGENYFETNLTWRLLGDQNNLKIAVFAHSIKNHLYIFSPFPEKNFKNQPDPKKIEIQIDSEKPLNFECAPNLLVCFLFNSENGTIQTIDLEKPEPTTTISYFRDTAELEKFKQTNSQFSPNLEMLNKLHITDKGLFYYQDDWVQILEF